MIKSSLIISTYNWPEALNLCLKSVAEQNELPDEIIIADDGSGEETKAVIQQFKESLKIPLKHIWQQDKGFRKSRVLNKSIVASDGDYLIFIDGDIILHPDFISDHMRCKKVEQFVNGSRVLLSEEATNQSLKQSQVKFVFPFFKAKNKLNGIRNLQLSKLFSKNNSGIYNVRGCNMAFWKTDLYEINGFDEQFIGWGREDSDIAFRAMNAGKTKFKLKFSALQYHLYHNDQDRSSVDRNTDLLDDSILNRRIKANTGLGNHL